MKRGNLLRDAAALVGGGTLFGLSLALFLTPLGVVSGGASGLAVTARRLWGAPVGGVMLVCNLPLVALWIRARGVGAAARMALGVLASAAFTALLAPLAAATRETLLGAVLGGALMGVGSGWMLTRGFGTGGSDLAALLLHDRFPRVPVGGAVAAIDAAVVLLGAAATRQFSSLVASAAAIAAYSAALERTLDGADRAKIAWIVTDRSAAICAAITKNLRRGATVLRGAGGYTGAVRGVVLCVTARGELYALKRLVREIDPGAFCIVAEAAEILGQGFPLP